jgi:glycine cleavage system pyridoxal-binding protein P
MPQTHEFHRNADGEIDFDFYRLRAAALRRRAMRDRATLNVAWRNALMAIMALSLATAVVARGPSGLTTGATAGMLQAR